MIESELCRYSSACYHYVLNKSYLQHHEQAEHLGNAHSSYSHVRREIDSKILDNYTTADSLLTACLEVWVIVLQRIGLC